MSDSALFPGFYSAYDDTRLPTEVSLCGMCKILLCRSLPTRYIDLDT
jgi:hypothetical protein